MFHVEQRKRLSKNAQKNNFSLYKTENKKNFVKCIDFYLIIWYYYYSKRKEQMLKKRKRGYLLCILHLIFIQKTKMVLF